MAAIYPMQNNNNGKQKQKVVKKKTNPIKDQKVIDYLDNKFLSRYTNDQGKVLPRRITGVSAYQQRRIANAIKYARHLALMPFVAQDVN
ncbi:MAG: 30S ribosomal protein S18 [Candidatus Kapabacteria bacterium]|nr:30S ribosomal protein S18 [Candidatus Kapabacteria bacterium]